MAVPASSDILILGGGMAGGLLAALLRDNGLSVRVLDGAPEPQMPAGEPELRVSAITEASQRMLDYCGAWSRLPAKRVCAYTGMRVWDADGTGEVAFDAAGAGAGQLGWIIENAAIVRALYDTAAGHESVDWLSGTRVERLRRDDAHWRAELPDGRVFEAPLLVGADGARSLARQAAGIAAPTRDSGHRAIVATVESEHAHGDCARQAFLESGPLALLPLFGDGHRCSLVWSCWPAEAERLAALDDDAFGRELTRASGACLGDIRVVSPRPGFPITELHASEYVRPGLALIGDAAHVVHPLAGQGINLGLLDAGILAEEILNARERGLPFHHDGALARYQRRRRGQNLVMQNAFRGFKVLFEQRDPRLRLLRNLGMGWVDRLPPVKTLLARQALGRGGDLPRFARS